ncbi:hypothetical protein MTR67_033746 [Solanum verrucosum]|uniref:TF-B3 domain-containing protein n=1 Tax=Solanum verrucosum TaxID=315347 RepID=A0AAF0U738_SOLVR|nr:hypothetical protein MTR67_033746 [Solanum verrucosum]
MIVMFLFSSFLGYFKTITYLRHKTLDMTTPISQTPASTSAAANPHFISTIKRYTFTKAILYFPMRFVKSNGLMSRCEMILVDEKQRSWSVWLGQMENHFGIKRGWPQFRKANGFQEGDTYKFELTNNGTIPIIHTSIALFLFSFMTILVTEYAGIFNKKQDATMLKRYPRILNSKVTSLGPISFAIGDLLYVSRGLVYSFLVLYDYVFKCYVMGLSFSSRPISHLVTAMKIASKKPQFFKPIQPGFKHGFKIPIGFLKYLEGLNHIKHAILKRTGKKWLVKVNDWRLEEGWEKFAEEHDLQLGDFLIFKHEGYMEFEVSIFDSSHCDREYAEYLQEGGNNAEETFKKVEFKEAATHNSRGQSHFQCIVRPNYISNGYLRLPKHFAIANGLANKKCGLIVRDERQGSWNLRLVAYDSRVRVNGEWSIFCVVNNLMEGDYMTFEVVANGENLVWKFQCKFSYLSNLCLFNNDLSTLIYTP